MNDERFEVLVEVMAAAAAGDTGAVFRLYDEFGGMVRAVLRRQLSHLGVEEVPRDELDGLVIDGCVTIFDCAGAWDPARRIPPWTWAQARLLQVAARWLGHHADPFDPDGHDIPVDVTGVVHAGPCAEPDLVALLDALSVDRPDCQLLAEALRFFPPRTRAILLELRIQADLGDPAPAGTVAAWHGMRPETVRQTAKRARDRLRALAASEPRFAPLAQLRLAG